MEHGGPGEARPNHSEKKPIETLEFGAKKSLLQGQAERMDGLCSKKEIDHWFSKRSLIGKIRDEGYRMCDFLLFCW